MGAGVEMGRKRGHPKVEHCRTPHGVRELKYLPPRRAYHEDVAPPTGVRIKIPSPVSSGTDTPVTPHAGAGVEIANQKELIDMD